MNYLKQWLDNGPWMEAFFFSIFIFIFHIFIIIEKRKSESGVLHFGEEKKKKKFIEKKIHSKIAKSFGFYI
jgi:hypothetical protein